MSEPIEIQMKGRLVLLECAGFIPTAIEIDGIDVGDALAEKLRGDYSSDTCELILRIWRGEVQPDA